VNFHRNELCSEVKIWVDKSITLCRGSLNIYGDFKQGHYIEMRKLDLWCTNILLWRHKWRVLSVRRADWVGPTSQLLQSSAVWPLGSNWTAVTCLLLKVSLTLQYSKPNSQAWNFWWGERSWVYQLCDDDLVKVLGLVCHTGVSIFLVLCIPSPGCPQAFFSVISNGRENKWPTSEQSVSHVA